MKLKLADWASISEIVGTLAVVVSLLLLVRSVDQNSKVIAAAEENNIWDTWRQIAVLPLLNNPEMAELRSKVLDSEELSTMEQRTWDAYISAQVDLFAQLFDRRVSGLISSDYWDSWESGYWVDWEENGYARIFESNRGYYSAAFNEYVDSQVRARGLIRPQQ